MTDVADARLAELEATVATLAARAQELEDDREIRNLPAGYGYMADNCGDEAVADSYGIAIATADGENTIVSAGNNQWQLRRVDGRWLIRERRGATLGDDKFTTNLDATPE